jgi:hypothetical protein
MGLEHDINCDCCEDVGCEQCDPDNYEFVWMKGIIPWVTTLAEAVSGVQSLADHLKARLDAGWELTEPEDNGHLHLYLPKNLRND